MAETAPEESRLREFRRRLVPDLYSPRDFIPWPSIGEELERYKAVAARLDAIAGEPEPRTESLADLIYNNKTALSALHRLFAAPNETGFSDGREFPTNPPRTPTESYEVAGLLEDLGIWHLITPTSSALDLLRVGAVAADARRRGHRRSTAVEREVQHLLETAIRELRERFEDPSVLSPKEYPSPARSKKLDAVISLNGRPVAAIYSVFQAQTGGNPQRVLARNIPQLQQSLDAVPLALIVIADGRGIQETPDRILRQLFGSVHDCMSIWEAREGRLAESLDNAKQSQGLRSQAAAPLQRIIGSSLSLGNDVRAVDLPVDRDQARMALASYADDNSELALALSDMSDVLSWTRAEVATAKRLIDHWEPEEAVELFARLLSAEVSVLQTHLEGVELGMLHVAPDHLIPGNVVVAAVSESNGIPEVVRELAEVSLKHAPEARIGAVLVPDELGESERQELRNVQLFVSIAVALLDPLDLENMATARRSPRETWAKIVLRESDLVKISPYVLRSATPERIFYGRDAEEASLLSNVSSQSIAILGGRRIGKTSLMRHARSAMEKAEYTVYYGDCQAVRTWEDFGSLAARSWGVHVEDPFTPDSLASMVGVLTARTNGSLILMLDEIDHLLDWDAHQSYDEVPESFFRTCRALSQEGRAQFIFSGERTIAMKLWDPHSPHWNFCQPLQLRQLSREATRDLLFRPLNQLQVEFLEQTTAEDVAWHSTSGHPQIVQFLGDLLVQKLNERPNTERGSISLEDINEILQSYTFNEHYLETYWGQATRLEKLISILLVDSPKSVTVMQDDLLARGVHAAADEVRLACRMLELYGIADVVGEEYRLRIGWFPQALEAYGGADSLANTFSEGML